MTTPIKTADKRIPTTLSRNSILADFCQRYIEVFDEIAEYNKEVLAEKSAEWTPGKVLKKARELGRPTDKNVEANPDIKSALEGLDAAYGALALARKNVLEKTSKELGIVLSVMTERNPELEAPLKEKRKVAVEIGTQLSMIAKMTSDEKASDAVMAFLVENPLPAVGRDQTRIFGADSKATPKYRVTVTVTKDGETLLSEDGFTKTALGLTKAVFGYESGKSPKTDTLRAAWENAGNSPEATVTNPVEFDDNGLHFVITKR